MRASLKGFILFLLCASIFIGLRARSHSAKGKLPIYDLNKPALTPPTSLLESHPWLKRQPGVKQASFEIARDLDKINQLSEALPSITQEELTSLMISKLLSLKEVIPFSFPESLYHVLCISDSEGEFPSPFRVYQRLYLGESLYNLPFYLDVRVYSLTQTSKEAIEEGLLKILEGKCEKIGENHYFCYGRRSSIMQDRTHGFAQFQGERGLFLSFCVSGEQLFVCYAEAPLQTFRQHEPLLREIALKKLSPL